MRVVRICAGLALAAVAGAATTPAQAGGTSDAAISKSIMRGDYADAERALLPRLAAGEDTPELLLNLAAVYALTGRTEAAQALYRWVLSERDAVMDLSERDADSSSAHAIAREGLQRLAVAARR